MPSLADRMFGAAKVLRNTTTGAARGGRRRTHQTCLSAFKNGIFSLDIYAFTPTLMTSQFSTWISVLVTFMVSGLFSFAVVYTLFLWATLDYSISQGEVAHDNDAVLLAPNARTLGLPQAMTLPKAGVLIMYDDGSTAPTDSNATIRFQWQQNVICRGGSTRKRTEPMPGYPCEFYSVEDGFLRTNATLCADWNAASQTLPLLNGTVNDACNTSNGDGTYQVPRVAGTFYSNEYAYITANVAVNATLLRNASYAANLFGGSVQLYLQFPYTGSSSLARGNWPDGQQVVWSRRVNLLSNASMKWEVSLRVRQVGAASYFWDIPSLKLSALDYSVQGSEVGISSSSPGRDGYQEVARVFIKLDDRDMEVNMNPYATLTSLFSDWGGFLSILVAIGIPAMFYNQGVFRSTVERLMDRGDITFDEDIRKKRSQAIATSFAVGVQKKDSSARRASMLRLANAYDQAQQTALRSEPSYTLQQFVHPDGGAPGHYHHHAAPLQPPDTHRSGSNLSGKASSLPGGPPPPPGALPRGRSNKVVPSALKSPSPDPGAAAAAPAPGGEAAAGQVRKQGSVEARPPLPPAGPAPAAGIAGLRKSQEHGAAPAQQQQWVIPTAADAAHAEATVVALPHPAAPPPREAAALPGEVPGDAEPQQATPADGPGQQQRSSGGVERPQLTTAWQGPPAQPGRDAQQAVAESTVPDPAAVAGGSHDGSLTRGSDRQQQRSTGSVPPSPPVHGPPSAAPVSPMLAHQHLHPGGLVGKLQPAGLSGNGAGLLPPGGPSGMSRQGSQVTFHAGSVHFPHHDGGNHAVYPPSRFHWSSHDAEQGGDAGDDDANSVTNEATYEAPQATAAASILVKYHQDIFEDSDEDENDFDDVVRHCTSECHALYHLRQVVKLVQHERSFLTCGTERYNLTSGERLARRMSSRAAQQRQETAVQLNAASSGAGLRTSDSSAAGHALAGAGPSRASSAWSRTGPTGPKGGVLKKDKDSSLRGGTAALQGNASVDGAAAATAPAHGTEGAAAPGAAAGGAQPAGAEAPAGGEAV